jgi:hypothetical protein
MRAFLLFAVISAGIANAQIDESGSLSEIEFSQLSQRDPNPLGEKALAIHPEEWKHSESEHFIYHFTHTYVATPVSVEAEFYYRVVAKELERDQPATDVKSHIYIFEGPEDWQQFQVFGQLEKWTGGIHSLGSLFVQRNPKFRFTDNSLGHEIVHLVVHRFYPDGVPCWFNEGLAQYISKDAYASYRRARGYVAKPHFTAIAPEDLIPLSKLVAMTSPPNEKVVTFYDESERLVRFLATTDKPSFLGLLDALGRHQPLDIALGRYYVGKFPTLLALEHEFNDYATKDYGTALRQTGD